MAKKKTTEASCARCGGPAPEAGSTPTSIERRMSPRPDGPVAFREALICPDCQSLKSLTEAGLVRRVLGAKVTESWSNWRCEQVGRAAHEAGEGLTWFHDVPGWRPEAAGAKPWAHIPTAVRAEMLILGLKTPNAPEPVRPVAHKSGRGCGICGVSKALAWDDLLVAAGQIPWPRCRDCASHDGTEAAPWLAEWIASQALGVPAREELFALPFRSTHLARTRPEGWPQRWGYLTEGDPVGWRALKAAAAKAEAAGAKATETTTPGGVRVQSRN